MGMRYFFQLDGIAGNSTDKGHPGWFDLESWSMGSKLPPNAGRGGRAPDATALTVVVRTSAASTSVMQAVTRGDNFKKAKIEGAAFEGDENEGPVLFERVFCDLYGSSFTTDGRFDTIGFSLGECEKETS
jgi:type VI protein secretion system component Hcp